MPYKQRKRGGRRRSQRGGACGCPKVTHSSPLPLVPWEPPGGMFQPGKVNGLTGGYYYGVNVDQSLPDPQSITNLGNKAGGRKRRRTKRKTKRVRRRRHSRRRRSRKRTKRRKKRRRSRQRGGNRFKAFVRNLTPSPLLDGIDSVEGKIYDLYTGFVGEKSYASPNVMVQPGDQPYKIIGSDPINVSEAWAHAKSKIDV